MTIYFSDVTCDRVSSRIYGRACDTLW